MLYQCQNCKNLNDVEMEHAGSILNCGICGVQMKVPRTRPASGWVYNDDVVLAGLVGTGGMSVVFKGYRISQDDDIAIKILDADVSRQGGVPQLFMQEARMATILEHPNIVKAYSFGVDRGSLYYVMEFIKGQTLEEIVEEHGSFNEKESASVMLRVTEALQYAWRDSQLLHRDVKPGNIMLNTDSEIKLMDLGLASCNRFDIDSSLMRGTYQYLCPEHILKMEMNEKSDIYSLGATLYYLLTGKFIFDDSITRGVQFLDAHVNRAPRPIRHLLPNMGVKLERMIMAMLDKSPDYRPNYSEVISTLKDVSRVMNHVSNPKQLPPRKNMYNTVVGLPLNSLDTKEWANESASPAPLPFRPKAGPAPSVSTNFGSSSAGTTRVKPSPTPSSDSLQIKPSGAGPVAQTSASETTSKLRIKPGNDQALAFKNRSDGTGGFTPPTNAGATGGFTPPVNTGGTGGFQVSPSAGATGSYSVGGPAVAPNGASTGEFRVGGPAVAPSASATNQLRISSGAPNLAGISGSSSASAGTLRIKADVAPEFPQTAAPLDEGNSSGTLRVLAHDVAKKREAKEASSKSTRRKKAPEVKSTATMEAGARTRKPSDEKASKRPRKRKPSGQTKTELDVDIPKIAKTESTIIVQDVSRKKTITIVVLNVILVALVGYYFTMV